MREGGWFFGKEGGGGFLVKNVGGLMNWEGFVRNDSWSDRGVPL